jgi:Putative auto-transporter adhesin, head GIN domain
MKYILLLSTAFIMLNSCDYTTGSGNIVTEKRVAANFTGISVGGSFDVEVKIGPVAEVTVEADDNVIKYVETTVSGNTLKIRTEGLHSMNNVHLKVYITVPELRSVKASASAEVKVLDVVKGDGRLSFDVSSSADIEAEVDAPEVDAEASSSGSVTISGKTKNYTARVSSSGNIKSFELLTENADVSANSSGTAEVRASVSLNGNASSSGTIEYRGGANVKKNVSSSGSVEKRD